MTDSNDVMLGKDGVLYLVTDDWCRETQVTQQIWSKKHA